MRTACRRCVNPPCALAAVCVWLRLIPIPFLHRKLHVVSASFSGLTTSDSEYVFCVGFRHKNVRRRACHAHRFMYGFPIGMPRIGTPRASDSEAKTAFIFRRKNMIGNRRVEYRIRQNPKQKRRAFPDAKTASELYAVKRKKHVRPSTYTHNNDMYFPMQKTASESDAAKRKRTSNLL